jgi:dTMP kinase
VSLFVTFEGPEGGGKTTQMHLLAEYLLGRGFDVLTTREPGGTCIGDRIRAILLDPTHRGMQPQAEILLFSAARAQIVGEVIRPHLARGGIVLCDRYADSTLAYQGYGRGLDLEALRQITAFATGGLVPDVTFYLDLPVDEGLRRKWGGKGDAWNRIEQEASAYHERVRQGYLSLIQEDPARWQVLDARQPVHSIQTEIRARLEPWLGETIPAGGRRQET